MRPRSERRRLVWAVALSVVSASAFACARDGGTRGPREPSHSNTPRAGSGAAGATGSLGGSSGSGAAAPAPASGLNADSLLGGSCATASVESSLVPAFLLLVLDRSGSMLCNPPPTTDSAACELEPVRGDTALPSKWEIVQQALSDALTELPSNVSAGISYFSNDNACGVHAVPDVPIAQLDDVQRSAIDASLQAVTPGGGTPMVGATILAYKHVHAEAVAGRIRGNKFVVLLTDGEQSDACSDGARCDGATACTDLLVDEEVPKAAGPGADIRTFVIGAPGSEPARTALSAIALAGGTAAEGCDVAQGDCHFDMTARADFAQALAEALSDIVGQALACSLPLPVADAGETDLSRVNVVYTPAGAAARVVPHDPNRDCSGANGWQYAAGNREIRLCGAVCDEVRADRGGRLDVVLGCPAQGPD